MTTIAFLGLGNMGAPMAANLVNAGYTVRGFDPVPAARARPPTPRASTVFDTGADAVEGADVVITMLPNGTLVKQCYAEVMPAAQARCAVHRQLHDRRRRRPRGARLRRRARLRSTRRPGLRRGQGRGRRHAGLHGRR